MSNNLLESLKEHLSGDVVSNLATLIGESPKKIESALHTALPLLFAELVNQSPDAKSIGKLFNLLVKGNHDGGVLSNLGALSRGGEDTTQLVSEGGKLLASLFGNKAPSIADQVANASGISKDSSTSLLGFVMPLVLGLVGRNLKIENSENADGLASLLSGQSDYLNSSVPADLTDLSAGEPLEIAVRKMDENIAETSTGTSTSVSNVTSDFDTDIISVKGEDAAKKTLSPAKNMAEDIGESASQFGSHIIEEGKEFAHSAADAFEEGAGGSRNFLPWVLMAAALALVWGLLKSCGVPSETTPEPTIPSTTAPEATAPTTTPPPAEPIVAAPPAQPIPPAPSTPEPAKVEAPSVDKTVDKANDLFEKTLSTGYAIKATKDGIENKLIGFIESNEAINKDLWHTIDRITFDTNKATIKAESNAQINDISEILKAYPKVKIKLAGYADSTGKTKANQKLSNNRANAVKEAFVAKGIKADRIETEGYGSEHPVANNDTEEGRQKNRRIDVLTTKK